MCYLILSICIIIQIYISSLCKPCVRVQSTDRMGIFFEESPGAVAYSFDSGMSASLSELADDGKPNKVGDTVRFDDIIFPYDFSIVAYVHSSPRTVSGGIDRPDCPKDLPISPSAALPTDTCANTSITSTISSTTTTDRTQGIYTYSSADGYGTRNSNLSNNLILRSWPPNY